MSTTQPIRNPQLLLDFKNYYLYQKPDYRNYALCILGLNTALRITDILNFKWKDIYQFETFSFRSHLSVTEKKTGKTNRIILNRAVIESMTLFLHSLPSMPSSEDYVFAGKRGSGHPLSRCQAYRIVRQAAVSLGMTEHISCHSLRKTFGYYAWKQGCAPAMLMAIYNHSSYQITKRYLGIEQDDKDRVFMNIAL